MKPLLLASILLIVLVFFGHAQTAKFYCRYNKNGDSGNLTKITLHADSTFSYEMEGHLFHEQLTGKYTVSDKMLTLTYEQPKNEVDSAATAFAPKEMIIRRNKLHFVNKKGKPKRSRKFASNGFLWWLNPWVKRRICLVERSEEKACY